MFRRPTRALLCALLLGAPLAVAIPGSADADVRRLARVDLYAGVQVAALDIGPSAIINPPTSGVHGKQVRAQVFDADTNAPLAGVRVRFHIGDSDRNPQPFCVATTDASGNARCTATDSQLVRLMAERTIEAIVVGPMWFGRAFNQFVCAVDCSQL